MTGFIAVFKREIKGYFGTPIAYVFLVIFLALSSHMAFRNYLYETREANLRVFFQTLPFLFALLAPAISMRMWAEERRTGTIEILFTLPITVPQAVLGKFMAGWLFFTIALALTSPLVATICYLGSPDWGPIFTGYLGALLMAGGYLAVGCFFSALTKNQVIAFIVSVLACGMLVYAGSPSVLSLFPAWVPAGLRGFLESMSFLTHYDIMQRGLIELRNIVYMLVLAAGFLVGCSIMLANRKAL